MSLSAKQKRFCENYVKSGNITQSMIKAGYSETYADSQGYKLLGKVGIKEYIDKLQKRIVNKSILESKEIQTILSDIITGKEKEEVLLDNEIKEIPIDTNKRLKAIDLLNKMQGAYIERVEVAEVETNWFK